MLDLSTDEKDDVKTKQQQQQPNNGSSLKNNRLRKKRETWREIKETTPNSDTITHEALGKPQTDSPY